MKSRWFRFLLIAGLFAFVVWAGYDKWRLDQPFDYKENTDLSAAQVDGHDLTLGDLSYYVLYEERVIEEQARIYNPKSTRDYWNVRNDGYIMSALVKRTVLSMGIHDRIFYEAAKEDGIRLTKKEKDYLANVKEDFWEDLLDQQWDLLPVPKERVNAQIDHMALAQKYQKKLAGKKGIAYVRLNWDGYDYKELRKKDHKVRINKRVWDRVQVGETTIRHDHVNFINGHNPGDKWDDKTHFYGFNMEALFGED